LLKYSTGELIAGARGDDFLLGGAQLRDRAFVQGARLPTV
jgi:hypothetical protein